jgi:hypothetical protein
VPGKWNELIGSLVARDVTLVPTYVILEARRDFRGASRAQWHDEYTMPYLAQAFLPNPNIHGSNYLNWSTADEIRWQGAFKSSMRFVRNFHAAGGRVAVGSDAGFSYQLYGFAFIRELELLHEAGLSALDVIKAATQDGAQLLGIGSDVGTVAVGKKADLLLIAENPLENLKALYGTGYLKYDTEAGRSEHAGGVRYTVKDGILWDAKELLADVRRMVSEDKSKH